MKSLVSIAMAATLALGGAATAADMAGMNMDKPADAASEKSQSHHAVGEVKAVNPAAGTITLSHDAVPSLKWPAMTMPFKASKEFVAAVKPGDRVNFEFVSKGMDATLTAIAKVK